MPIYMPWLTVSAAVLVIVGGFGTACSSIITLYFLAIIFLLILSFLQIINIPKSIWMLCCIPVFSYLYFSWRIPYADTNDLSNYLNREISLVAQFTDFPLATNHSQTNSSVTKIKTLTLDFPEHKKLSGQAQLIIVDPDKKNLSTYHRKQIVQIKGKVHSIDRIKEPWEAGFTNTLKHNGILCQIHTNTQDIRVINNSENNLKGTNRLIDRLLEKFTGKIDQLRQQITQVHIHSLGNKVGSLLASIVLGDRAVSLDTDLITIFRKVGLSHILAASGFNLTIVTLITYWCLRILGIGKQFSFGIVTINIIFYATLAGFSASIVRAAITCILVLTVRSYHRSLHSIAALALVFIVNTIIDPKVIFETGAQLSYVAVAGIIYGAKPLAASLSGNSANKLVKIFCTSIAVVLSAQMSVLPIQVYYFWQVSLLFLPANLLIDPLVAPITVIGFLASILGLINLPTLSLGLYISHCLDQVASIPVNTIIYIAEHLASCDFLSVTTGQPSLLAILSYYSTGIFLITSCARERLRLIATILFLCALFILFYKPDLKQPTIICLPRSIIAIGTQRQAICLGENNIKSNKIISYYAASIKNQSNKDMPKNFLFSKSWFLQISNVNSQSCNNNFLCLSARSPYISQKYLISLKTNCLPENIYPISPAWFQKNLPDVDLKMCCPHRSISFYLMPQ